MSPNILITGAVGFIGGSVVHELLKYQESELKGSKIVAAVRGDAQLQLLSKLNVTAVKLDVTDRQSVQDAILTHEIDIVIHTAGIIDHRMLYSLIGALGERKKRSGHKTWFINSSVLTMFTEEAGWPFGEVKDSDGDIVKKSRTLDLNNPARNANIIAVDEARANDVALIDLPIPLVYGRGTGEGRKISVNIPAYVRTSAKLKVVHKFDKSSYQAAIHVQDLVALYAQIVLRIVNGQESVPSGEVAYYFAFAHRVRWWAALDVIAQRMYARGLVDTPQVETWSSYDEAADQLGFPRAHCRAMGTSSGEMIAVNPYNIGWKPKWGEKEFMDSLDDEIADVLELDTVKASIFDSLLEKQ